MMSSSREAIHRIFSNYSSHTTTFGEITVATVTLFYRKADVYAPFARLGHRDIREYISLQSTHFDYGASCLLTGLD